MFFLVSAVCAWLVSKHLRSEGWNPWLYLGLGIAAALLYLARPHGALFLAVCVIIVAVTGPVAATGPALREASSASAPSLRKKIRKNGVAAAAIVMAAFASVLLVIGSVSYASGWGLQGLFHRTGWVYLMYGANYAAGGMHNVEDADLIMEGRPSFAEMNRRARELALERISADVPRLTQFAFTEKMRGLYGRDPKLFRRAHGGSDQGEMLEAHVQPAVERVKDGAYRLAFLLFLALLAREVWRPGRLLVLGFIVLLYSLPHLLLEVDQRMHQVMLPYIIAGAALLFYELAPAAGRKPWMRPERFTQRAF